MKTTLSKILQLALTGLVVVGTTIAIPTKAEAVCSTFDLRSEGSTAERELIVVNAASDRSAKLYWVDFNGEKVLYSEIPPLGRHVQSTYQGHVWVVENSLGYCDSVFVVENNVEITVK